VTIVNHLNTMEEISFIGSTRAPYTAWESFWMLFGIQESEVIYLALIGFVIIGYFSFLFYVGIKKKQTWAFFAIGLSVVLFVLMGIGYAYLAALGRGMSL